MENYEPSNLPESEIKELLKEFGRGKLCPICKRFSCHLASMHKLDGTDELYYDCVIGDHAFTFEEWKKLREKSKGEK